MYVCICRAVKDKEIKNIVVNQGIDTLSGIRKCTGAAAQCGKCALEVKTIISDTVEEIKFYNASQQSA